MNTRRGFVGSLAAASLPAVPRFAVAQRSGRLPRVALVFNAAPIAAMTGADPADRHARLLVHTLRDLGYVEGRNIVIERRSAEGRLERLPALMQELLALDVDVIVGVGPAAVAAQRATGTVPIVALVDDPETSGLAASLARPGRNITGVTGTAGSTFFGKLLQLLNEAASGLKRVAVIDYKYVDSRTTPGTHLRRREFESAARQLGLTLIAVGIDAPEDVEPAFARSVADRAEALVVSGIPVVREQRRWAVDFAARHRLPAIYDLREFVDAGGLMSYGSASDDQFRRAAAYVDKILKGARPADLPFEQPTRFELVLNLKTAKALGLTFPRALLLRAEEVIE